MMLRRLAAAIVPVTVCATLLISTMTGAAAATAATVDRQAPTRPGPLTVQSVATTSAVVDFGKASDNVGVARYLVYGNGRVVGSSTSTRGVVAHLRCGTVYTVGAEAVDRAGNHSLLSPVAHLRTHACLDTTAPARPANLHVVRRTDTSVTVAWSPSIDPGHGRVREYELSRNGATVAGSHRTTYRFTGLQPHQRYRLAVRARDAVGNVSRPASARVTTARPPQATGALRSFVLATDGASIRDAQAHYRDLQWIFPTYFDIDSHGQIVGSDQPAVTRWFQLRGVKVMPRFHTEDPGYIESATTDPAARAALVDAIVQTVQASGFDGASLDLEMTMPSTGIGDLTKQQRWDRLRAGFTTLVQDLADRLHALGKLLSVDVAVNWCNHTDSLTRAVVYCSSSADPSATTRPRPYLYDYVALAHAADELWLLSWGLHWSTSEPGPIAGSPWLAAVGSYFTDLFAAEPTLMQKLTMGVQLYGFDWSSVVVRTDSVTMPGGVVPAAPACGTDSYVAARPVYSYSGDETGGTLTVTWMCNTRAAVPLEYADVLAEARSFGTTPTWDPVAQEETFTAPDSTVAGAQHYVWFADAASVEARSTLADGLGWHLGLWRLGREDQALWTRAVAETGAGS